MYKFIGIECLAVNALIELYVEKIQRISFKNLVDYGLSVVKQYNKECGQMAVLIFDPDDLQRLVINYSDFFDIEQDGDTKYLCLNQDSDINKVKKRFRWTLSYRMIRALNKVRVMTVISN